ncbi:hypothetical protein P9112_011088 [Eukaryota sp. TZLM1-RC]
MTPTQQQQQSSHVIDVSELDIDFKHGPIESDYCFSVYTGKWFYQDVTAKLVQLLGGKNKLLDEIKRLSCLNHPGLIRVFGISAFQFEVGIIMEHGPCSIDVPSPLTPITIAHALAITSTIAFLHAQGTFHGRLNAGNILMVGGKPKIAGIEKYITDFEGRSNSSHFLRYVAPEDLNNNAGPESDIYSLGVLLYELLCNQTAYEDILQEKSKSIIDLLQVKYKDTRLSFNADIPRCLQDIIHKCMSNDPIARPSIDEIFNVLNGLENTIGICEVSTLSLQSQLSAKEKQCGELLVENEKLKQIVSQVESCNHELNHELQNIINQCSDIKLEKEHLISQLDEHKEQNLKLNEQISRLTNGISNMHDQNTQKDAQLRKLGQYIASIEANLHAFKTKCNNVENKLEAKDKEIDQLKITNAELIVSSHRANQESKKFNEFDNVSSSCSVIKCPDLIIDYNQKLGQGGFATVYAAKWFSLDVAVKIVDIVNEGKAKLKKEIAMLVKLNFPGVLRVFGVTYINDQVGIVMERADGKLQIPSSLSNNSLTIAKNICCTLKFLQSHSIIHGDIKPDNVLFVNGQIRLADFGTSRVIAANSSIPSSNAYTAKYAACEVLDEEAVQQSDLYSVGVLLYELLTNEVAYKGYNQYTLMGAKYHGKQLPFANSVPPVLRHLINRSMDNDISQRPSIDEVLEVLELLCT